MFEIDQEARDLAHKAQYTADTAVEKIEKHMAMCVTDAQINRQEHASIITILKESLDKTVSRDRFTAIERLVWGVVMAILLGVVTAGLSLVLK